MAKKLTNLESFQHKNEAVTKLDSFLSHLIAHGEQGKADKLSFWIKDWINYLEQEKSFKTTNTLRYRRGNIIKAHLGFNVGSEQGGLHYAIVIDAHNYQSNPVLTIIPLTSVKSHTDISNLRKDQLYLGSEIYDKLIHKLNLLLAELSSVSLSELSEQEIENFQAKFNYARRIKTETSRMKTGSIALIDQITTISKMRIFDPKNSYGVLKGIKISDATLDKLDRQLKQKFFKN